MFTYNTYVNICMYTHSHPGIEGSCQNGGMHLPSPRPPTPSRPAAKPPRHSVPPPVIPRPRYHAVCRQQVCEGVRRSSRGGGRCFRLARLQSGGWQCGFFGHVLAGKISAGNILVETSLRLWSRRGGGGFVLLEVAILVFAVSAPSACCPGRAVLLEEGGASVWVVRVSVGSEGRRR